MPCWLILISGHFGEVYYAKLQRGSQQSEVALKTVQTSKDRRDKLEFERVQSIMPKMAHPNIVRVYGLSPDENQCMS